MGPLRDGAQDNLDAIVVLERTETGFKVVHATEQFARGAAVYNQETFDAEGFLNRFDPEDNQRARKQLHDAIDRNTSASMMVPVHVGSRTRWLLINMHPWMLDGHRRALVTMKDVSLLRQGTDDAMLWRAVDQCPYAMAMFDMPEEGAERRLLYVNDAMCAMLKQERGSLFGAGIVRYLFPTETEELKQERAVLLREEAVHRGTTQAVLHDGTSVRVRFTLYPLGMGPTQRPIWMIVCRDVTREYESRTRLGFLEEVVDEAGEFVMTADVDLRGDRQPHVTFINRACATYLGEPAESLQQAPLLSIPAFGAIKSQLPRIGERFCTPGIIAHEVALADGKRWMEFVARCADDSSASRLKWLIVGRDITKRRQQLRQTAELIEAFDALGTPAAIYSVAGNAVLAQSYANEAYLAIADLGINTVLHSDFLDAHDWRALRSGREVQLLQYASAAQRESPWYRLAVRQLSSGESTQSIVISVHGISLLPKRHRMRTTTEAVRLAEEIMHMTEFDQRLRALRRLVQYECGATVELREPAQVRRGDVLIDGDYCHIRVGLREGILSDNYTCAFVQSDKRMDTRKLTGLRVLFETMSEIGEERAALESGAA